MYLVVTIDTEEDDWGGFDRKSFGVENIKRIPKLQKLFDEHGVTPTYLVTYPVLDHPESAKILGRIHKENKCEIGMHCHPWNTPPIEEAPSAFNSMLCNLPEQLQARKLASLHRKLEQTMGIRPSSFRAGRWGYGGNTALALQELGVHVDSSVAPRMDWSGFYGADFSMMTPRPYRFQPPRFTIPHPGGTMIEVPATIDCLGLLAKYFGTWKGLLQRRLPRLLHLEGFFRRSGLLNKVWLSPETTDVTMMKKLTRRAMRLKYPVLNLFFHSTALLAGLSPFVKTIEEEDRFTRRLGDYLRWVERLPVTVTTLSQAANRSCQPSGS